MLKTIKASIRQLINRRDRELLDIAQKVTDSRLSYLGISALYDLAEVARKNERKNIKGAIVETGCALGGSSIVLAYSKAQQRELFVYDIFGMIPPPSNKDGQDVHNRYEVISSGKSSGIDGDQYYGYIENLYEKVINNFASYNFDLTRDRIHLVKGLYEETLKISFSISLAHIDCDWFDSVLLSLQRIEPNLVSGRTLVIDDYYTYSGCRDAVDKYFKDRKDQFIFTQKSRLHIVKK
ncbi:TylF/MycF/NovP-related O-methyltransferase [Leptothermofonsia sp. ETS-13]|uniref:TylF/MycF/NovP-related O-methyltransferase n=1 Tax=Leptothermofonsia sp. ETS-13 TaxID=3035696 RepID=UPI003B9DCF65